MDHHADLPFSHAECFCRRLIDDVIDDLDFQKMIPGTKRSALRDAPLPGFFADMLRLCPVHCAVFLAPRDIAFHAVSHFNRVLCAVFEHTREILLGQSDRTLRTNACWDGVEKILDQFFHIRNIGDSKRGRDHPNPAVDIKAHAPGRDNPGIGIEGTHTADRKTVAPVDIGHPKRIPEDARKRRHVGKLGESSVFKRLCKAFREEKPSGNTHPRNKTSWDLPLVRSNLLYLIVHDVLDIENDYQFISCFCSGER